MWRKMRNKKRGLAAFAFFFAVCLAACTPIRTGSAISSENESFSGESQLEVHYIDVGQGDATLLVCDGEAMLIDAGENDTGTKLQQYLNSQKITSLRYVVGTHPDSDHIGGMDVILTKFDCETALLTEEEKDTATYRDVADAIRYKGIRRIAPKVGEVYELGSASFTIAGPIELCGDSNDNSIALVLSHGNNRFYFEGDASEKEEEDILGTGVEIGADVYKTGHHGSKTSTTDDLLEAVNPQYAVISAGEGNSYGHPSAETLNKLRERGVLVFRTDEQGTIVAVSDGDSITWNASPSESWLAGEPGSADGSLNKEERQEESDVKTQDLQGEEDETRTVHITESGKKYHAAGCPYLKDSDTEISLEEAKKQGYEPCRKCTQK